MAITKPDLWQRLKEGYEVAKKPIAYIVMFAAVLLQTLPSELIDARVRDVAYPAVLLVLALILLEMLFKIYERTLKNQKRLPVIPSSRLHESILSIVAKERKARIKYIGVAGRNGWTNVLEKLLNENDPDSLVANRTQFKVDVALLDPEFVQGDPRLARRFGMVESIANNVRVAGRHLDGIAVPGSWLRMHFYSHMPNMLGILVNENYLFATSAYWTDFQGEFTLRAGGTNYFVYDKNDDFGGQEVIRRFCGWFEYILRAEGDVDADRDREFADVTD